MARAHTPMLVLSAVLTNPSYISTCRHLRQKLQKLQKRQTAGLQQNWRLLFTESFTAKTADALRPKNYFRARKAKLFCFNFW